MRVSRHFWWKGWNTDIRSTLRQSKGAPRFAAAISAICAAALAVALLVGCSRAEKVEPLKKIPRFDGSRAYELLVRQVEIGPRHAGTPGHERCVRFIKSELKPYADGIATQEFTVKMGKDKLEMANILAHFRGKSDRWVLLAAHWDNRPTADLEIDAAKRKQPIPGANDGASGVAVLLELARLFADQKPDVGVFMAFFDGEDYGPGEPNMLLGSKEFARKLASVACVDGKPVDFDYGIVLDMVGDKDLKIYQERGSASVARKVVQKVWTTARKLGHQDKFIPEVKYTINDDHVPLIRAGVKCIDVIDFDYGSWHTLADTPDKCSAGSLRVVGETIARVVYDE